MTDANLKLTLLVAQVSASIGVCLQQLPYIEMETPETENKCLVIHHRRISLLSQDFVFHFPCFSLP